MADHIESPTRLAMLEDFAKTVASILETTDWSATREEMGATLIEIADALEYLNSE